MLYFSSVPRKRGWVGVGSKPWSLPTNFTEDPQHPPPPHPPTTPHHPHPTPHPTPHPHPPLRIAPLTGQSLKSQCESNILSTHIPLIPCQSAIPFLRYDFFKIWPWKSKVKVMGEANVESHKSGCNILSTHIPFVPCQSALPFLRYSIFRIWPWKSKAKVKWPWCCITTDLDDSIELQMV